MIDTQTLTKVLPNRESQAPMKNSQRELVGRALNLGWGDVSSKLGNIFIDYKDQPNPAVDQLVTVFESNLKIRAGGKELSSLGEEDVYVAFQNLAVDRLHGAGDDGELIRMTQNLVFAAVKMTESGQLGLSKNEAQCNLSGVLLGEVMNIGKDYSVLRPLDESVFMTMLKTAETPILFHQNNGVEQAKEVVVALKNYYSQEQK